LKSLTGDEIEKVNLQIVLGDGNDSVILKQITGQTSIYGGQGIDEVTVGDGGDLSGITGGIIFDGDAHIDEVTYDVTWSELQSTTPGPYPDTFANTGGSVKKGAFTGSNVLVLIFMKLICSLSSIRITVRQWLGLFQFWTTEKYNKTMSKKRGAIK